MSSDQPASESASEPLDETQPASQTGAKRVTSKRRGRKRFGLAAFGFSVGTAGSVAGGSAGVGAVTKLVSLGVAGAIGGSLLTSGTPDAPDTWGGQIDLPEVQQAESVAGSPVSVARSLSTDETRSNAITALPEPEWPGAAATTVELPDAASDTARARVDAATMPVGVRRGDDDADSGSAQGTRRGQDEGLRRVTLRMGSHEDAKTLGVDGVVFSVSDPDGAGGSVEVELDYSRFATAYGASWASRLKLVELPECALTTPEKSECRTVRPVESRNNTKDQTLVGQVVVRGDKEEEPKAPAPKASGEQSPDDKPDQPESTPTEEPADTPTDNENPTDDDGDAVDESDAPTSGDDSAAGDADTAGESGTGGGDVNGGSPSEAPSDADAGDGASEGGGSSPGAMRLLQDDGSTSDSPTVLAAVAGAKGPDGDFTVSDLSPAGEWSGGGSSGDFSYSYPIGVPGVPGGLSPDLSLAYNSGSVDGKTASTNAQASWVGDGWSFAPGGYIERSYRTCADDKGGNEPEDSADLCWFRNRMTIAVGGVSGELVKDESSGEWVVSSDSGAKVERLTGVENGARNGEYWKVTTTDGTQYFLGRNRLPGWASGKPVTNSVNTVPVFGNDSGEPCHATAFKDSWCEQAWRWNLDLVIDPLGNAMTFHYAKEKNAYTRGAVDGEKSSYVRASYLKRIKYGLREGSLYGTPTARVDFTVAERCLPDSTFDCAPAKRTSENAERWPDTPVDLECRNAAKPDCQAEWHYDGASGWWEPGAHTPAFFTTKRLRKITTKVHTGSWQTVDSWALEQSFPGTGDGLTPALWLNSIQRTGHAGTGDPISTPKVTFEGNLFDNRVDLESDRPYSRYRITGIDNGHGGFTGVRYRDPECSAEMTFPKPHQNTLACFPVKWKPYAGYDDPITDWFHKYVVAEVIEQDRTGGHLDGDTSTSAPVHTRFEYLGNAAWAWDANDTTKKANRTWSVWRGYGKVRTLVGDPNEVQPIVTEKIFARGMHGDRLPTGSRSVNVSTTAGDIQDHPAWAGMTLEKRTLLDGAVSETTVTVPWKKGPVATASRDDGTTARAYRTGVKGTKSREKVADGSWRYTQSKSSLNDLGQPVWTEHLGEVSSWGGAPQGDVTCETVDYVDNESKHILGSPVEKTSFEGRCSGTATSDTVLSSERLHYDGRAFGQAPTKGLVTKARVLGDWTSGGKEWTATEAEYDKYGRQTKGVDVHDGVSTTEYTPATGLATTVTATDPLGHTTSATMDPKRGQPVAVTDASGYTTQGEFDTLGRTLRVWGPGRSKSSAPDAKFAYDYNADSPNWVRTRKRRDDGSYATSYTLLDGLLRKRQTQSPAVGDGRIVEDTIYDTRGLVETTYGPYWNENQPGTDLIGVRPAQVPAQTDNEFDTMGRKVTSTFLTFAEPQWSSETIYHGADLVANIPPQGGTATAVVTNAVGEDVEKRDYKTFAAARAGSNSEDDFQATRYDYTLRGELASVVDPGGARWSFEYDLAGNRTEVSDPDAGVTTSSYDAAGQLTSTTDASGKTLAYGYDAIGRNTEVRRGSASGELLVKNVFDTLKTGLPTSSTRFVDGHGYKTETLGYDDQARPTGTRVTIPDVEGPLAGQYDYETTSWSATGNPLQQRVPGGGTLDEEVIYREYNTSGLPTVSYARTVGSASTRTFVSDTSYSVFGELVQLKRGSSGSSKNVFTTNFYEEGTRRLERTIVDRETSTQSRVADRQYSYDDAGNITRIADVPLNGPQDVQCFDQDWLGRLTQAWTPGSGDCGIEPTTANLGGAAPYWLEWQFDQAGNRAKEIEHTSSGQTTRTFDHPAVDADTGLGQPHTTTSMVEQLPSGSEVRSQYSYDQAGNTISRQIDGDTQTLEWNAFGRVSKVVEADGAATEYVYGPEGERLIVRDPEATTLYLPGMELRLPKGASEAEGTRYYRHGGATVAQLGPDGPFWLHGDHQGTSSVSIGIGSLDVTRRYQTPYGELRGSNPPLPGVGWPNYKGFVGGEVDTTAGLTHIGARHYDTTLGRFISIDPLIDYTDPVQMHGYGYARWSPVTLSDPDGLDPKGGPCIDGKTSYGSPCAEDSPWSGCSTTSVCDTLNDNSYGSGGNTGTANSGPSFAEEQQAAEAAGIEYDSFVKAKYMVEQDRSAFDVFWEQAKPVLGELTGITPIVNCFQGAGLGVCFEAVISVIPWGKVVHLARKGKKAGKVLDAIRAGFAHNRAMASARATLAKVTDKIKTLRNRKCPTNSFVPGTQVVMADGSTKPIEDVKIGDKILATDPETGETRPREVTATWINAGFKTLVEITVDTDGDAGEKANNGKALVATGNHPFWVPGLEKWVRADQLQPGTWLQTSAGTRVQVGTIDTHNKLQQVHNLTTATDHTYYVATGNTEVLGHNKGGSDFGCGIDIPDGVKKNDWLESRAKELGYTQRVSSKKLPFNSKKQPAYWHPKRKEYLTPDITGHKTVNGWKVFNRKGIRQGTYDANMNRIGS